MDVDVRLRAMTAGDAPRLAVLCTQLGYPSEADDVESRLTALNGRTDDRLLVAEDHAGEVVGWVHVHAALALESPPWAEVGGLVVDERVRGGSVGGRLLAAAEQWARGRGFREVRVRSNVIRREAHEFYRKQGYETIKTQVNFRKRLPR